MSKLSKMLRRAGREGTVDPLDSKTVLYLDFQGTPNTTDFVDKSIKKYTILQHNNTQPTVYLSNDNNPFGSGTYGRFIGQGGGYIYVQRQNTEDFTFTGDFSIEIDILISHYNVSLIDSFTGGNQYYLWINFSGQIEFYSYYNGQSFHLLSPAGKLVVGGVTRIIVTRKDGIGYMIVNDEIVATIDNPITILNNTTNIGIGAQITQRNPTYDFIGSMGKLRITNGASRGI